MSLDGFKYFTIVFYFLMGLILSPFVLTMGPVVEMKLSPVVTHSVITKIQLNRADDSMYFWGKANKLKDCVYDHVEWFSGDPEGAHTRLTMEVQGKPKINKAGETFEYGPIKVYINEDQLRSNTFAIVYHRCHPIWLSQSIFYP